MLLDGSVRLADEPSTSVGRRHFPFVLSAGERRSLDGQHDLPRPRVAQKDPDGSLRITPADAGRSASPTGDLRPSRTRAR